MRKLADYINRPDRRAEAPKIAIIVVLGLIVCTWIVIVVSWFVMGEYPAGLVSFTQWLKMALMGQTGFICIENCVKYNKRSGRGEGGGNSDH
ncbi:MAG: hypothetical protein FWC77_01630 [Defluviitaleaceae bacterium]|nr:hypothetical protein [Defluviitaleaceae bacterium]